MKLRIVLASIVAFIAMAATASPQDGSQPMCLCKFAAPSYSAIARQAKIQGIVRVDVSVDSDGLPGEVTVVHSSHPILSEYVTNAIKQWRFCSSSAKSGGKISLTFKFELEGTTGDWAPTYVTFDPSGEVDITTAAVKPSVQR
jgi:TonB family protein